jgi:hypothetical protein
MRSPKLESMKILFLLFSLLIPKAQANELEIIHDVIALHQKEARAKYGFEIAFKIEDSPDVNAYVTSTDDGSKPLIVFMSGFLKLVNDDEILLGVCHEVGHILGEMSFGTRSQIAFESEADYFAGKCAVRYYQSKGKSFSRAQESAVQMFRKTFPRLLKERLHPQRALSKYFEYEIDSEYAEGDCRLLSTIHGALERRRPSCWYNPKVK